MFNKLGIELGTLTGTQLSIIGFVDSLPNLGNDTTSGGMREIFEKCVTPGLQGEAIVGVLREGQNARTVGTKKPFGLGNVPNPVEK